MIHFEQVDQTRKIDPKKVDEGSEPTEQDQPVAPEHNPKSDQVVMKENDANSHEQQGSLIPLKEKLG